MLGFAGPVFRFLHAQRAEQNLKLMFTLSDTTNNSPNKWNFVFLLAQPPMSPVLRALASPKGLKGKNPRPSAAVRRILGAKKPKIVQTGAEVLDFFLSILLVFL